MKKHTVYYILTALAAIIVLTLFGWQYYIRTIEKSEWGEPDSRKEYIRHYAMVPDDAESAMWEDIFNSAQTAAQEQGAYVELFDGWAAGDYSPLEYIDIAVAAKVDGIIVKPDGTAKMREAINKAEEANIPVITILDDDTTSSRKSFVGVNSYQMGTTYGKQILSCVDERTRKITVLLNHADSGKDLIFKELKATVQTGLPTSLQGKVEIQPLTITSASTFDAEEVIRDLINNEGERPDILVCMNENDSVCAYHAMVDYNQVGSIDIIGYYQSDTILDAIRKKTVPMAITLDAKQMGQRAVEALEEYYKMGYVSNYFSVDLNIITEQNVMNFQQKESR